MKQKNNLLYFSIIFTALAVLSSLNFQMKIVTMLFLLVAVFVLDTQDGFVLSVFSLCFLKNIDYRWVTSVVYLAISFGLMLKAILLYNKNKKLGKWQKCFVIMTTLYFVISPIVKGIVFKHFSVGNYAYMLAVVCLVGFVCYAYGHINFKKLGKYLSFGVVASFGLAILLNTTEMIGSILSTSKWGNIAISSLACADLIFALSVVAQSVIVINITKKQASILEIIMLCAMGIVGIFSCPTLALIVECLIVAIVVYSLLNNKEKLKSYSITLAIGIVLSVAVVALIVNIKDWTLFDSWYKEIANIVMSGFDLMKGEFSTIPYLIFGKNAEVKIDSLYISYIYNFGIVGVAICLVYLIWVVRSLFKNGTNKNCWGLVIAILLSTAVSSVASIVLLTVGVLSTTDNLCPDCVDNKVELRYGLYAFIKRTFDIVVSFIAIVILLIPMILLTIINAVFGKVPPLIRIKRVGKDGKTFTLYKFRSMYVDAESRLEHYLTKEQIEIWKRERKIDNDPRITKVGKILRKTSLDELPQLFNILIGDLSIIGNRPLSQMEYDTHFNEEEKKLLDKMRPGLTGYWQVYGRSNVTFLSGERQKMYLHYSKHANLWLDIKIFFKTFLVVLTHKGAK